MTYWITPNRRRNEFPPELALNQMVEIYDESTRGWLLEIAKQMEAISHSGYAVLMVLLAYPERVWQFRNNRSSNGRSQKAFMEGMLFIVPELGREPQHLEVLGQLWDLVRCGLAHTGMTKKNVSLSGEFQSALGFVELEDKLWGIEVNPHKLADLFLAHHRRFVLDLREGRDQGLRDAFEGFFKQAFLS